MKIASHSGEASFFVSFSDVLFALMSIFVFLMLIVATQVHPPGFPMAAANRQKTEIATLKQRVQELTDSLNEKTKSLATTEKSLAEAVAVKPIDLVIMVDGTGSMQKSMDALNLALSAIADEVPKVTSKLRIGIIIYREKLREFQLSPLPPATIDCGTAKNALHRFLEREMRAIGGSANISDAMDKGLQWLSQSGDPNTRKAYMVVGDIGPYEMMHPNGGVRDLWSQNEEQRLTNAVRALAQRDKHLSVLMFIPQIVQSPSKEFESDTVAFFQNVATAAGEGRGALTRDSSEMMNRILLAILASDR